VLFAANRLVLAVPKSSRIAGLTDLERPGLKVAVGAPTVPVGAYAAAVLARLPSLKRAKLLANIRDREPDVTGRQRDHHPGGLKHELYVRIRERGRRSRPPAPG
jgi:ABC-type molybdate transport system substrate-binding protein